MRRHLQLLVQEVKALQNILRGVTDNDELRALEEDITGKVTSIKNLIVCVQTTHAKDLIDTMARNPI